METDERARFDCELCFNDKSNVLKKRCMKGSLVASVLAYAEALKWNRTWVERYVDFFVCPSAFMAQKMEQGGFDKSKLKVICNFVDPIKLDVLKNMPTDKREQYYLYVGRLSEEKGVKTLLEVASKLPYRLKVAGGGPLLDDLKIKYANNGNIEFLGHQNASQVSELLASAVASVMPSECYENNPLSVIESLCAGTPVVGAKIGGVPELIGGGDGFVFESRIKDELADVINMSFSYQWNNENIKKNSLERFSPERYLELIQKVYQ